MPKTAVASRPIEIAYVDDSPSDQLLAAVALTNTGQTHHLVLADSAQELYASFADRLEHGDRLPDIIVVDLKMPRVNGHQLIRRITLDLELCNLPVVVLSTSSDPQDIAEAYNAGVSRYEVKPSRFDELVAVFERVLALARTHQ